MHNNYYILRRLSNALGPELTGAVISECFTQNRDELVIRFERKHGPYFLRANLAPTFSCLSFPDRFQRAKKNSTDLFPDLIGTRVIAVRQFANERCFAVILSDDLALLFKMHGNRSNIVLFKGTSATELFKKNLNADLLLKLEGLDRQIDWSFEAFARSQNNPSALYFTFGKLVWEAARAQQYDTAPVETRWQIIQRLKLALEKDPILIVRHHGSVVLSLLKVGDVLNSFTDPVRALNEFFYLHTEVFAFNQEKAGSIQRLQNIVRSNMSYVEKAVAKLRELEQDNHYKVWADVLMANLHAINPGAEKAVLENFYRDNEPIEIRLKKDLSIQKNAELFYRKARNQQIEMEHLRSAIREKQAIIRENETLIKHIAEASNLTALRKVTASLQTVDGDKPATGVPYHEFQFQGFKIWVGKNAESNDRLTQRYSYKEDLWLHAKDVSGSHVLIKHQAGKNFPKDVVERAAQLAAYNSKRRNDSLCPVIVTPKKYVRKRKGDPPGAVVVERERVVMVEPKL